MCTAPALPWLIAAAGGLQAATQLYQGNAAAAMGEYNATVARQEARYAEATSRDRARRILGAGRAAVGASGVQLEGSPLDVLAQSAAEAEMDALAIRRSGQAQAAAYRYQGRQAQLAGYFGAAGTALLTGASVWDQLAGGPATQSPTALAGAYRQPYLALRGPGGTLGGGV